MARHAPSTSTLNETTDAASGGAPRVLVVEDNTVNRLITVSFLERLGCEVFTAINGADALAQLETQDVSLIIMDCHMPEMNGFEATRAIRAGARHAGVPIVALTASQTELTFQQAIDSGMNEVLFKPIQRDTLADLLSKWIPKAPPEGQEPGGSEDVASLCARRR